jgi:DNA-directed RNA polymerase specialized sigma24 family protein
MIETGPTCHQLIERAEEGDENARRDLLELYRDHLRRMVAARLDSRVMTRVDASDVVQDTLSDAAGLLGSLPPIGSETRIAATWSRKAGA